MLESYSAKLSTPTQGSLRQDEIEKLFIEAIQTLESSNSPVHVRILYMNSNQGYIIKLFEASLGSEDASWRVIEDPSCKHLAYSVLATIWINTPPHAVPIAHDSNCDLTDWNQSGIDLSRLREITRKLLFENDRRLEVWCPIEATIVWKKLGVPKERIDYKEGYVALTRNFFIKVPECRTRDDVADSVSS